MRLITLWLHLLAVILWMGGTLFMVLVLLPVTRKTMTPQESIRFYQGVGKRFQVVTWIAVGILIMTGIMNILTRGMFTGFLYSSQFFQILGIKLAFFTIMVGLIALHSFVLIPRMVSLAEKGAPPEELGRLRKKSAMVSAIGLLLGLFILFMGLMLTNV